MCRQFDSVPVHTSGLECFSRPRDFEFMNFPFSSRFAILISTLFYPGYISDSYRRADGMLLICGTCWDCDHPIGILSQGKSEAATS
jgi:hypothetical protein